MPTVAKWRKQKITISTKTLMDMQSFASSVTLKEEQKSDDSGTTVSQNVGFELQPMSFNLHVADAAGVDVRKEFETWSALVGKSGAFYMNGKRFGPNRFKLKEAVLGDVMQDNWGRWRAAMISLSFIEDDSEGKHKVRKKKYVTIKSSSAVRVAAAAAAKTDYVDGLDRRL